MKFAEVIGTETVNQLVIKSRNVPIQKKKTYKLLILRINVELFSPTYNIIKPVNSINTTLPTC